MERYKLLIVDDDLLVRLDLHSLIDWDDMRIDLVNDASNGVEAMEAIEAYHPDIVILDLGMPLMNGLEVIEKMNALAFKGKVIVLSCHEDFDNVKEAMKMGAIDYLRKHLYKKDELVCSINKAIEIIKNEAAVRTEKDRLIQFSEQNKMLIRNTLIRDLVTEVVNIGEWDAIRAKIQEVGLNIDFSKYLFVIIEIDDLYILKETHSGEQLQKVLSSYVKILENMIGNWTNCLGGITGDGEYCFIMNFHNDQSYMSINNTIYDCCTRIFSSIMNYLNIQISIGISKLFCDITHFYDSYSQARLALDGKLYLGKNRIIHFSEIEDYTNIPINHIIKTENDIVEAVTKNENIKECIVNVFSAFRNERIKTEYFRLFVFELLVLTSRLLNDFNIRCDCIFSCDYLPYHYVMRIETIEEFQVWFEDICTQISVEIGRKGYLNYKNLNHEISKSLEYIEMNYDRDISLQEIADYVNLSRTYFSNLFKKETGKGFVEYLINYRIEKAKELLNDSCRKIYRVGVACGFSNYRYFARTFKKITNLSPGQYREMNNKI